MTLMHMTAVVPRDPGRRAGCRSRGVLPRHLAPLEKPALVNRLTLHHLLQEAVETMTPIRYAVVRVLLAFALARLRRADVHAQRGGRVPGTWFRRLASLKTAGALALLIGLGVPLIGSAAALVPRVLWA